MDFINEVLEKAKDVFEVAKEKTDQAVAIGKQKYDIAALESRLNKSYGALGRLCFENYGNDENTPDEIKALIAEIENEIEAIALAREELAKIKSNRVCPTCGKAVSDNSAFCNHCGEKLIYTEE